MKQSRSTRLSKILIFMAGLIFAMIRLSAQVNSSRRFDSPDKRHAYVSMMLKKLCTDIGPHPFGTRAYEREAIAVHQEMAAAIPGAFLDRYLDALDLPATTVGGDVAKRHFDEGIEASQKLWGIPVVTTIKADIYDSTKAWVFSPQAPNNFLGNFYLLQDATLFLKQEADMIEFWSYEAVGLGIGNRLSLQQISFV